MTERIEVVQEDYELGCLPISQINAWGEIERDIYRMFILEPDSGSRHEGIRTGFIRDLETGQLWYCEVGIKPERCSG